MNALVKFWKTLNPKVQAAAVFGILGAIVATGNAFLSVYPNRWYDPIVVTVVMLVAAYRKAA